MYFKISWDTDFDTLMMHLWSKYGKELFTLDGIGDQMDLNKFSKNFFNSAGATADVSVDSNANVVAKTGIEYNFEMPKPLKRYNSYFLLWKELKKAYGLQTANEIIEAQLTGDIYINDFTDIASPYSYHPATQVLLKNEAGTKITSLKDIFNWHSSEAVKKADWDEIDLSRHRLEIFENRKWVALTRAVRHENRRKMIRVATSGGRVFCVTDDHPCILADGSEKPAGQLALGDCIKSAEYGSAWLNPNVFDFGTEDVFSLFDTVQSGENWVKAFSGDLGLVQKMAEAAAAEGKEKIFCGIEDGRYFFSYGAHEPDEENAVVLKEAEFEDGFVYDVTTESGRFYSAGCIVHNCFNYSTNDIAYNGLDCISKRIRVRPPKSLDTFLRQVEQFVVVAANSTLGATGFADLLLVASRYVDKMLETGKDGHVEIGNPEQYIKERLTAFVYTVNWEFRGNQSPFTNLSLYDDTFLDSLCPDYGAKKETVKLLQRIYVDVMNEELARSPITFPVTTACFCKEEDGSIKDKEFLNFIAEANLNFGWINLYNGDTSTLSSCCRLRSNKDNPYFNSFGAGSTKIGSLGVVTANLPRLAMKAEGDFQKFMEGLEEIYSKTAKINASKRRLVKKRIELGAAPLYTNGYMDLSKQYSTFGIVGINEAVQLLGGDILTEEGQEMVLKILGGINKWIDKAEAQYKAPHNVEQVPAESSAIKLATKDKMLGYDAGVPLYSNQFIPLIVKADMLDRLRLQGLFDSHLSGGAIAHINIGEKIKDPKTMVALMEYAAKHGVVYWAVNYLLECCDEKHLWVGGETCPVCGKKSTNKMTRVVGFLTSVPNWHPVRRKYDFPNRQFYGKAEVCEGAERQKRDEVKTA